MFSRIEAWFDYLTSDPLGFAVYALYLAGTVLLSLILHEVAHGYVALRCGDPTAKWMGRLTLDPRKHLDPVGTVCMLLLGCAHVGEVQASVWDAETMAVCEDAGIHLL